MSIQKPKDTKSNLSNQNPARITDGKKMETKNLWNLMNNNPPSNRMEKLNILFSGLIGFVSLTIALITCNQQQEIKGMNEVIQKLTDVSTENSRILATLDASSKPILKTLSPRIHNAFDSINYNIPFINYGGRTAYDIRIFVEIFSDSLRLYNLNAYYESLAPNENKTLVASIGEPLKADLNKAKVFVKLVYRDMLANRLDSSYSYGQNGFDLYGHFSFIQLTNEQIIKYRRLLKMNGSLFD